MSQTSDTALYSPSDIEMMRLAEAARLSGQNRVAELIAYARQAQIKRIGIACCISLRKEAEWLKSMLENDFEITMIDCKIGAIQKQALMGEPFQGMACNPAGQAQHLSQAQTELNVSVGLCMGHDIVFNQKSQAPVTTLIVKDRQHHHNPYKTFERL